MGYLRESGWRVTGSPRAKLFRRYGLHEPADVEAGFLGEIVYVSATR